VKNGIIMIDYIDVLQDRDGMSRREALIRAGRTRFRPVLLTATTAVLGLVPLAIGFNFNFVGFYTSLEPELFWGGEQAAWWAPMAIAIIVGVTFATVLTLIIVPVLYSLVDDFSEFFARHYISSKASEVEPESLSSPTEEARPRRRRIPVEAFSGLFTRRARPAEE
jgi:predicted RND superfamily exporter protein